MKNTQILSAILVFSVMFLGVAAIAVVAAWKGVNFYFRHEKGVNNVLKGIWEKLVPQLMIGIMVNFLFKLLEEVVPVLINFFLD
ncbi:MAG: hypothetical protein K6E51_14645 [Treponema sp.]|nr:hypothetical protein [Treponema sp.]